MEKTTRNIVLFPFAFPEHEHPFSDAHSLFGCVIGIAIRSLNQCTRGATVEAITIFIGIGSGEC